MQTPGASAPRAGWRPTWLRSRATICGYYNNPEGTAAEFSKGFWKSGDLAYLDDEGFLYIVDRKKDMIISGGFNVYAIEVEAGLNSHPAVAMSAVVGKVLRRQVRDKYWKDRARLVG
ncbi:MULTISPECIES: hypothetical protein [Pseudomonas]|uniref:hypothetical protein n=1 Tax=Pseudomonas TaxID=286 RepID=UPI0030826503